jgi:hypothetical protein
MSCTALMQRICIVNTGYSPNKTTNIFSLTRKSQLHSIICNNKGVPDYLAINIYYDTLRSGFVA